MEVNHTTETDSGEVETPKPFHCTHHAAERMVSRFPSFVDAWQMGKFRLGDIGPVAGIVERFALVSKPCRDIHACSEFMKSKKGKFGKEAEYIGFGNMVFVVVPQDDPWAGTKLIVTVIKREVIMNTIREFNYTGNRWRRMRHREDLAVKPSLIKRKKWK